jgi:hypothetical protein
MAGDWIKIEHSMPDKPEIGQLADRLEISYNEAIGMVLRFWIWADQQSIDGYALSVTEKFIDHIVGRNGFAAAMRSCGWLASGDDGPYLPNFNRHNGDTAKKRAQSKDRMTRKRYADGVTEALPEKRREELEKDTSVSSSPPPYPDRCQEYWRMMSDRPFEIGWYQKLSNKYGGEVVVMACEKAALGGVREDHLNGRLEGYIVKLCQGGKAGGNGKDKSVQQILAEQAALTREFVNRRQQ